MGNYDNLQGHDPVAEDEADSAADQKPADPAPAEQVDVVKQVK